MILYDGTSDIDWKYEGVRTAQQMRSETSKKRLFEVPCVLFDAGDGRVVGFETVEDAASRFCVPNTGSPRETIERINAVVSGTYKAPGVAEAQATADEAKATADTAAASMNEYMDALLGLNTTDETEATDAE